MEQLRAAVERPEASTAWAAALDDISGTVRHDHVEFVSTEFVFEYLGVHPLHRTPQLAENLRAEMVKRGWMPVRGRHVTGKGFAARVRGYARLTETAG